MQNQYLDMLQESLEKKIRVLQLIQTKNHEQEQILADPNALPDDLDKNLEQKASLIEQLNQLDAGFEQVYARVKEVLDANRESYSTQIKTMQDLIRQITDLSANIQAQEQHNKNLAEMKFANVRKQVKEVRQSQQAVSSYYKNMMKINYIDPQFMDNKK